MGKWVSPYSLFNVVGKMVVLCCGLVWFGSGGKRMSIG